MVVPSFPVVDMGSGTYRVVNVLVVPRIVIDVYRDVAQGANFGAELVEPAVVLSIQRKRSAALSHR